MPFSNDPTVFPCGRGNFPGTQGPGSGGQEPTVTPSILVPSPPDPPEPPYIPPSIPVPPDDPVIPPVRFPTREPDPGTVVPDPTQITTTDPTQIATTDPAQTTTTDPSFFRCEVVALGVCPGEEGLSLNEATITTVFTECRPCSPNIQTPGGSVEPDPTCNFSSLALCEANCTSPTFTNLVCPPQGAVTQPDPGATVTPQGDPVVFVPVATIGNQIPNEPSLTIPGQPQITEPQSPSLSVNVINEATQITNNQEITNGNIISVNSVVEDEDFRDTQAGISKPVLFDPDLNFFNVTPNQNTELVSNSKNLNVFNNEVAEEVSEVLSNANSNIPWNEVTLQNLSDDKLLVSLNPLLRNSFEYLRLPGGKPVGVATLLNVIRKHLLRGTIDEFDPNYYIDSAQAQLNDKFDVLEKPERQELADRLAINFLTNNLHTYQNNKSSNWRNFQINRVRPLNEDVKIKLNISNLDGTRNDLDIPNEGFDLNVLEPRTQITSRLFGSTDKLNIGDGGGYYVHGVEVDGDDVPIYTDNIISDSYYAPASIRAKVLEMLDIDSSIKIQATSNENKHEFVSDDQGASGIQPLFFALDTSSIVGEYTDNPLVESYSGTYTRIKEASAIDRYTNNHALSIPLLALDYRDPIYRYILDTSEFIASLKDFNLVGFPDKGFSSIGSRFVKNIPFGFIVTPVAGGKYNPFNGDSILEQKGTRHVRSISVIPATDLSIDANQTSVLKSFSLNLVKGVDRVGVGEESNTQNIGYQYSEEDFTKTFYSASAGDYQFSSSPPSAQGTAYMLRNVIDYLKSTYGGNEFTWFDVFSRMPITQMGQMFYDSDKDLILEIANGFRDGVILNNVESGHETSSRLIAEDSKTIVKVEDRRGVTTVRI